MTGLSHKHQLFVSAVIKYPGDLHKAARASGYTDSHARQLVSGARYPKVKEAIDEALSLVCDALQAKGVATREEIVEDLRRYGDKAEGVGDFSNAIRSRVEIGKISGHYVQRLEHSGKLTVADIMASVDLDEYDTQE